MPTPTKNLTPLDVANTIHQRDLTALDVAKQFHEVYERLAPDFGYATRDETKVFDPTSANGMLMVAVAEIILNWIQKYNYDTFKWTTMSSEMKPCPFCGLPGRIVGNGEVGFEAQCGNPECGCILIASRQSEAGAMVTWNRRSGT